MRIAYLIGCYPAINHGYLLREVQEMRRLGFEIVVSSISSPDRPVEQLTEEERTEAASTYYVKDSSWMRVVGAQLRVAGSTPIRYMRGLWEAVRLGRGWRGRLRHILYFIEAVLVGQWMQERGVNLLYAHFSATVALIAAKTFPITMAFGVYGFGELHDPAGTRLAERIRQARLIRAISKHARSLLMLDCDSADWDKIRYVPLGIDPARISAPGIRKAEGTLQLASVGRLSPEKGQRILLQAIHRLAGQGRDIRLHLVGDGPDRKILQQQAQAYGILERVVFEGWVDQERLDTVYRQTDVLVMASLYEGIPIVLMEAMAMEIPCVAPWITGIPELIRSGEEGLLFAPADAGHLAECVAALMDDAGLRRRMGSLARRKVLAEYDIVRNTGKLADMFRAL